MKKVFKMDENINMDNSNEVLITVIIPVYKVEDYIEKCVNSVLGQTYKNLEIILIDDGSPDRSGEICDAYAAKDKRVKVIHKENEGVSVARNIGLDNANGMYIAFIDADDWIEENYLHILLSNVIKENADNAICNYNRVTGNNIERNYFKNDTKLIGDKEYLIRVLNPQTGFGFSWMKLIKRESINDIRFNKTLIVGEDAIFNIEIAKNVTTIVILEEALYNYRNRSSSVVKKYDTNYVDKYLRAIQATKKYIFDNYKEKEIIQNYYNFVAFHVLLIAVNYCYNPKNEIKNKKKLLRKICSYDDFKEGIEKSNYKNISYTRQIALFTLKHKLYSLIAIICKIRQFQNIKQREG